MAKRRSNTSVSKQRSGVEDVGMEYQYNVITYMAASLSENPTVKDFVLFSNLSDIPGFDDLVFKVWYKGDSHPHVYLGQIKHRNSKINFETEKHKLSDYKRDMLKIINNKENTALLQDVPTDNVDFLFYSNNGLMKSKSILIDKQVVPFVPLLCNIEFDESYRAKFPVKVSQNVYKFSALNHVDDEDSLFFDRTRLLLNQSCNRKIIYDIMDLYKGEFSKNMAFGITRYVREYFRIPTVTNITKDIFETELFRIRLSKYIMSPTKAVEMNVEPTRMWNNITLDYDITMVDDTPNVEGVLCGCYLQKINDLYSCDFKWNDCINKNRRLITDFNVQPFVDRSKFKGVRYWLAAPDTIDLLLQEMWKYADLPLMLRMDAEASLLARYQHLGKKVILICDVTSKYNEIKTLGPTILASIADIADNEERSCFLGNIDVSLQGRTPINLEYIIGEDPHCMKALNCSEIHHLIKHRKAYLEVRSFEKVELMIVLKEITIEKLEKCEVLPVEDSIYKNVLITCHDANVNNYMELIINNSKFQNYSVYHVRESQYGLQFISGDKTKLKAFLVDEDGNHIVISTSDECVPVIGNILGAHEHAYISRNVRKPIVHPSIFQSKPRVYFLCGDLEHLQNDIQEKMIKEPTALLSDIKLDQKSVFINVEYSCFKDEKDLRTLSFETTYPVLFLEVRRENLFLLNYKNCEEISSFILYSEDTIAEGLFFNDFHTNKITVISGEAGMGKTALLNSLSQAYDGNYYALFCNLPDCTNDLKDLNKTRSGLDYVFNKYTRTESCYNELLRAIYKYHISICKVILFIDSFDEVLPVCEEEVLNFIKNVARTNIRIIIASRTIATKLLIDQLQIYPLAIDNLRVDDAYLKSRNLVRNETEAIPEKFMVNPLLLKFLILLSEKRTLHFTNINVVDLYKKVILEKIKRYHDKIGLLYDPKMEYLNEDVLEIHRLMALVAIFGREWIIKQRIVKNYQKLVDQLNSQKIKLGIVKEFRDGFPIFMHISFAEFLVAQWLSINLFEEENAVGIYQKMVTECDRNIQYLFDSMVCGDLKLHKAVINGNLTLVQNMCRKDKIPIENVDECGRSCLHLASNYCLEEQNYKIMEILINRMLREKLHFETRDTYMKWNWFEYLKFKNPEYFERACSFGSTSALKVYLKFEKRSISSSDISNTVFNCRFPTLIFLLEMNTSLLPNHFHVAFNVAVDHGCITAACELIQMHFGHDPRLNTYLKVCQGLCALSDVENAQYLAEMQANQFTALHIACMYGHVQLVEVLLRSGISRNVTDDFGRMPIHYAVIQGSYEIISLLLVTKSMFLYFKDERGYTALHYAIRFSNRRVVQLLLGHGEDYYEESQSNVTHLQVATKRASIEICKTLLEYGVCVDERNPDNSSAFLVAAEDGNLNILHLLVNYGADIEQMDAWGNTALHLACFQGHEHVVDYLIKKSHKLTSVRNRSGLTPMEIVIMSGKSNIIEILGNEETANTNEEDVLLEEVLESDGGYSLLHLAKSAEEVRLFLSNGVNIDKLNAKAHNGETPLHAACKNGYFDVVHALLKANADIFIQDGSGQTPLHLAVQDDGIDIVKLLLGNGASANTTNNIMETALYYAIKKRNAAVVELLLEHSIDVNQLDYDGKSALHIAAKLEDTEIAETLIRHGADVNETDYCKMTPLHVAVKYQNFKIASILLDNGADVNLANNCGDTALQKAVEYQNLDIVRLLLKYCARISHVNNEGQMAVHIALMKENTVIQNLLLQSNIAANNFNNCKDACLRIAILHEDKEVAKMMLENGADINHVNSVKDSLLHVAVEKENEELVEYLFENGIDINLLDLSGQAALHIAVRNGNINIVNYLFQKAKDHSLVASSELSSLHIAVENENVEMVNLLLEFGADINFVSSPRGSALHIATAKENMEIVKMLLEGGIDANLTDSCGQSALHVATKEGKMNIVKVLLEAGADINLTDSFGRSALRIAIEEKNMVIAKALLEIGMNIILVDSSGRSISNAEVEVHSMVIANILSEKGIDASIVEYFQRSALHAAVNNGKIHILKMLLEKGVNVNLADSCGGTGLQIATTVKNINIVKILLSADGIDVNHLNCSRYSALHYAVNVGAIDIAKALLSKGADINLIDSITRSLLHIAVRNGNLDVTRLLLENGIFVNHTDSCHRSAAHIAVEKGNVKITELLLENGIDINMENIYRESALHVAVETGHVDIVRLLLKNGADVAARFNSENTILHIAAIHKHVDIIGVLLADGVNVNLANSSQQSALHYLVISYRLFNSTMKQSGTIHIKRDSAVPSLTIGKTKRINCIEMLLENGIDINHVDTCLQSALHVAAKFRSGDVVQVLLDNGADVNLVDNRGNNILHIASQYQHIKIIKAIIEKVAFIDTVNRNAETALHFAVRYRDVDIVKVILENGADINKVNGANQSPFCLAVKHDKADIVKLLLEKGADVS